MPNFLAHEFLLEPGVLRMALVLGVVVAALIYDRLHLTTGSILVPGYLGAGVLNPTMIAIAFLVTLGVFWTVYKLMPRHWLMGWRQKFLVSISISAGAQFFLLQASGLSELYRESVPLLLGVGYVIPGLIAHDAARHGLYKTLSITAIAALIVALVVFAFYSMFESVAQNYTQPEYPGLTFSIRWIGMALLVSIVASAGLQNNYGLRAGGFVGSGYLSLVLVSIPDIAYLIALSLATYWLVVGILMKQRMILFGRRKFVIMVLCSAVLSWSVLLVVEHGIGYRVLIATFLPMASVFLPGLFANDLERVGITRLIIGTALVMALTLSVVFLVIEITEGQRVAYILPLATLSGTLSAFIFIRHLPERLANFVKSPMRNPR